MNALLQISESSLEDWSTLFPTPAVIYDSAAFLALNSHKCERLVLLTGHDKGINFGLAAGLRGGTLHAPFSAPFCTVETSGCVSPEQLKQFIIAVKNYCITNRYDIEISMPPACYSFYDFNAIFRETGFSRLLSDLNFHVPLHAIPKMTPTARNKAARARREGFQFEECPADMLDEVYATIKTNRDFRGYPLRMTLDDLRATLPIASGRLFSIRSVCADMAAAAVIYRPCRNAYQLIYWGHIDPTPGVMNLLATELFSTLAAEKQTSILDLGPASDRGQILPGLARFKTSLGAISTEKPTFCINPE